MLRPALGVRILARPSQRLIPTSQRRFFSIEPRHLQSSRHGSHRALYRWTLQALGVPFAVGYICDRIADNSSNTGGSSFKLDLPWPGDMGMALSEPIKVGGKAWGMVRDTLGM